MVRLGLSVGVLVVGSSMSYGQWSAQILSSGGFLYASSSGIGSGGAVGYGAIDDDSGHALLWSPGSTSFTDLHPTGYLGSAANGASSNSQIGTGDYYDNAFGRQFHALLWHGTASSVVDLNPDGWATFGRGGSENSQVGQAWGGSLTTDGSAALWHGTAASMVILGPDDVWASAATAATDDSQVGYVRQVGGSYYAAQWHGTQQSLINLNPSWAGESYANGISGSEQVGSSRIYDADDNSVTHATLWKGTAASAVDLNPAGFENSYCYGNSGNFQVGGGRGFSPNTYSHALVWQGSAESVFDLNSTLPVGFTSSIAYGILDDGTIIGNASDDNGTYVVRWSTVPEPSSVVAMVLGVGSLVRRRRRN